MIGEIDNTAFRNIAFALILVLMLSGCDGWDDDTAWRTDSVTVNTTTQPCGCTGTIKVLENRTDKRVTVTLDKVTTGTTPGSKSLTKKVSAHGSVPLGCSKATSLIASPGHEACDLNISWIVKKVEKGASLQFNGLRILKVAARSQPLLSENLEPKISPKTCWIDCTDPFSDRSTGSCLAVNQTIATNPKLKGIHWLADEILAKPSLVLPKQLIMKKI